MILTQIIGLAAIIIDGVVTSRTLGSDAYSAIALIQPFVSIVLLLAGFLSVGNQVVCSRLVGMGEKDKANHMFSVSLLIALAFSLILLSFCIFSPDTLLRLCGVSIDNYSELYQFMTDYLKGYMLAVPAILLIQVMGPIIVLDNNKSLFTSSTAVLCISDIIGDLLNVFVLHGGVFGMGVATTISYYLQGIVLLTHFFRKNAYFHLSLRRPTFHAIRELCVTGYPAFMTRLATTLRNLFISRYNLAVALSVAGVAAKGIQGDINNLLFCFSLGLGRAMSSLTSLHYGAKDRQGLKRLFTSAFRTGLIMTTSVGR